jgi:hypothetical protein
MKLGKNKQERSIEINRLLPQGSKETYNLQINETDFETYSVHHVELDFPKYRITNTRTKFDQVFYIKNNKHIDSEFFSDHERLDVQEAQHNILKDVYRKKGLYNRFKSKVKQDDPLVMAIDGFIISGNRRLAIFRDLVESDSRNYDYLKTVKIIIYPYEVDSLQAEKLEAILETDESTKLNFEWINVAMKFIDIMKGSTDPDYGYDEILSNYSNSEYIKLKRRDKQIGEIDMWIDAGNNALRLVESEQMEKEDIILQRQVFKDWAKNSRSFSGSHVIKEIYDRVAEIIIKTDSSDIGDRKYKYINHFRKHFDRWFKLEIEQNKLILKPSMEQEVAIAKRLKEEPEEIIFNDVIDKINLFNDQEKFKSKANALLKLLAEVSSKLHLSTSIITDHTNWGGVEDHVKVIEGLLRKIKIEYKKNNK